MFARTEIQGRLGTYELTMTDTDGEYTSSRRIEVAQPVKIEWGEQGREYPEQILKSRMELEVLRGAEYLRPILFGGFARRRFEVNVQGPGVDWVGFIEPESRRLPLSTKTRPQSLSLLISDDFEKAKNDVGDFFFAQSLPIDDLLDNYFGRFQNRAYVRIDGQWEALATGDLFGTGDVGNADIQVDLSTEKNLYDSLIAYLKTTRGRIYRPLSEKGIVLHSLRETGQGLDAYSQEANALRPLPGKVVDLALEDLIDEEANVEDVTQAGTIEVDMEGHNLAHFGVAFGFQNNFAIDRGGPFDDPPEITLFRNDNKVQSIVKMEPGFIDPSDNRILGLFLSFEVGGTQSGATATVKIDDLQGNFTTQVETTSGDGIIEIVPQPGPFEPEITIQAEPDPLNQVTVNNLTLELIDFFGNIVETVFNVTNNEGVEPIEIERGVPPKGSIPEIEIDPPTPGDVFVPLRTYQNADLNIDADQPFLARIAIERAYRPTGIQSVEAEVFGLHGPEDLLLIDIPTGQNEIRTAPFVCGQGRSVNLTTGTTRISDVEVPADILPTNVL